MAAAACRPIRATVQGYRSLSVLLPISGRRVWQQRETTSNTDVSIAALLLRPRLPRLQPPTAAVVPRPQSARQPRPIVRLDQTSSDAPLSEPPEISIALHLSRSASHKYSVRSSCSKQESLRAPRPESSVALSHSVWSIRPTLAAQCTASVCSSTHTSPLSVSPSFCRMPTNLSLCQFPILPLPAIIAPFVAFCLA